MNIINNTYTSPSLEILDIEYGGRVLCGSPSTDVGVKDWEDEEI